MTSTSTLINSAYCTRSLGGTAYKIDSSNQRNRRHSSKVPNATSCERIKACYRNPPVTHTIIIHLAYPSGGNVVGWVGCLKTFSMSRTNVGSYYNTSLEKLIQHAALHAARGPAANGEKQNMVVETFIIEHIGPATGTWYCTL